MGTDPKDLAALNEAEFARVFQEQVHGEERRFLGMDREPKDSKRQSGRTTRAVKEMCLKAMEEWGKGSSATEHIYVVLENTEYVKQIIQANWSRWVDEKRSTYSGLPAPINDVDNAFRHLLDVETRTWAARHFRKSQIKLFYDHAIDEMAPEFRERIPEIRDRERKRWK